MTAEGIERLIRSELVALNAYPTHKSPETLSGKVEVPVESIIKLDANENPYGCSSRVSQALAAYPFFNIYPDARQTELRRQLQEYTGVDAVCIVAANGSGELLDDILRLFIKPGDKVVNCVPTFDMFRFRTLVCQGELVNIPRGKDFTVDIGAVTAAIDNRTKIIILANPNSPTGTVTPRSDILELADAGVPLLVDEAYYEFYGETMVPLVSHNPNLMVIRTFSKWAGLAGLRIGYGIFPPVIADYLLKIKLPYNVSMAASVAVRESLVDIDYLMSTVEAIIAERERLFTRLAELNFLKPFTSRANFIFCSVLNGKASELQQRLQRKGILVRYFDLPFLENSIRISVGKPEHTDALIKAFQELEEEING
ncbi:histidinol-phosphate transaminase [Chloroflexota bacterium]